MRKFEVHFPKQAKNIDDCKQLDDETKTTFFKAIDGITPEPDKDTVGNKAKEYFHNNQFKGQQLPLKEGERLGHLHSWSGFINFIGTLQNLKDVFDKDKLEPIMLRLNRGDLSGLEEMFELLEKALIPFLTWRPLTETHVPFWCFRTETHAPFEGIHLESLPCRLGLDDVDIQKFFPIEITPPLNIVAKIPTAFDAGLFEHWYPGGKTCHRDDCKCQQKDGLDEVVIQKGLTYGHVKAPKIK